MIDDVSIGKFPNLLEKETFRSVLALRAKNYGRTKQLLCIEAFGTELIQGFKIAEIIKLLNEVDAII